MIFYAADPVSGEIDFSDELNIALTWGSAAISAYRPDPNDEMGEWPKDVEDIVVGLAIDPDMSLDDLEDPEKCMPFYRAAAIGDRRSGREYCMVPMDPLRTYHLDVDVLDGGIQTRREHIMADLEDVMFFRAHKIVVSMTKVKDGYELGARPGWDAEGALKVTDTVERRQFHFGGLRAKAEAANWPLAAPEATPEPAA